VHASSECSQNILNKLVGNPAYTCGARIEFLQTVQGGSKSELEACFYVAKVEFPHECGKWCDLDRCDIPFGPKTPQPTHTPLPPGNLYCFPPEDQRIEYKNMRSGLYTIQVKSRKVPSPADRGTIGSVETQHTLKMAQAN